MKGELSILALTVSLLATPAAAAPACNLQRLAELPVTMERGQPTVTGLIGARTVKFNIASGAARTSVSRSTAMELGALLRPSGPPVLTAAGRLYQVSTARFDSLVLGDMRVPGVTMMVTPDAEDATPRNGELGLDVLRAADVELDLANGMIRLFRSAGCRGAALAYWSTTYSVMELEAPSRLNPLLVGSLTLNGQKIRAMLHTGSYASMISTRAAARAGLAPGSPGTEPGGTISGLGRAPGATWTARVAELSIGDERLVNTRIVLADFDLLGDLPDAILGQDFLLSHRIYIAHDQRRAYFTHNGGPVFRTSPASLSPASARPDLDALTGEEWGRRGAASLAREDWAGAVSDLDNAIALQPEVAAHYYRRGFAHLGARAFAKAIADLDRSLELAPGDVDALRVRAGAKAGVGDREGARRDLDAAAEAVEDADRMFRVAGNFLLHDFPDGAALLLDRWIAANPRHAGLLRALAMRCSAHALWGEQLERGLADCDAVLRRQGRSAPVIEDRGLTLMRLGRSADAIKAFDDALKIQPRALSLYGRGLAKRRLGSAAEAEADLKAASLQDPEVAKLAAPYRLEP